LLDSSPSPAAATARASVAERALPPDNGEGASVTDIERYLTSEIIVPGPVRPELTKSESGGLALKAATLPVRAGGADRAWGGQRSHRVFDPPSCRVTQRCVGAQRYEAAHPPLVRCLRVFVRRFRPTSKVSISGVGGRQHLKPGISELQPRHLVVGRRFPGNTRAGPYRVTKCPPRKPRKKDIFGSRIDRFRHDVPRGCSAFPVQRT
jgi:hypothetical protein